MTGFAELARGGMVRPVATCENGHENPEGRLYCGDCGIPIVSTMAICVQGHVNLKGQQFCGDCGVPIRPPVETAEGSRGGRWNVDPSGQHQYRYWDGATWTEHVADNGAFSADPFTKSAKWHPETWVGVAAGIVTILLVIGAIVGIATQLRGGRSASATDAAGSTSVTSPTSTSPQSEAQSTPAAPPAPEAVPGARGVAVIGSPCRPNSTPGLTADGSTAYCELLQWSGTTMWSLVEGDIALPEPLIADASRRVDPGTAVCMAQTGRTAADCVEYLQRPSDPGDAQPAR